MIFLEVIIYYDKDIFGNNICPFINFFTTQPYIVFVFNIIIFNNLFYTTLMIPA